MRCMMVVYMVITEYPWPVKEKDAEGGLDFPLWNLLKTAKKWPACPFLEHPWWFQCTSKPNTTALINTKGFRVNAITNPPPIYLDLKESLSRLRAL